MTYARSILIPRGSAGTFHCVSRCVRWAFLCGEDRLTGRSFEHRRQWVEDRAHQLAGIFGVAIWGYAVMSDYMPCLHKILIYKPLWNHIRRKCDPLPVCWP